VQRLLDFLYLETIEGKKNINLEYSYLTEDEAEKELKTAKALIEKLK